jgi:integrase
MSWTPARCRDRVAAASVLAKLEAEAERSRRLLSSDQRYAAEAAKRPLAEHIAEYVASIRTVGRAERTIAQYEAQLTRLARECKWGRTTDITGESFEKWLTDHAAGDEKLSARTRNSYTAAAVTFVNWLIKRRRMASNPIASITRADQDTQREHIRRALADGEEGRLMAALRLCPLAGAGRPIDTKKEKKERYGEITPANFRECCTTARARLEKNPQFITELERDGIEHALAARVMLGTGFRAKEAMSLRVVDAHLDGDRPSLSLRAQHAKNRTAADQPISREVARAIRAQLERRLNWRQQAAKAAGQPIPLALEPDGRLLQAPSSKAFRRAVNAAGIKPDAEGRVVDRHSLRMTYVSRLGVSGMPMRSVQLLARHSDIRLTANVYSDATLFDTHQAIEAAEERAAEQASVPQRATGTADEKPVGEPREHVVRHVVGHAGRRAPTAHDESRQDQRAKSSDRRKPLKNRGETAIEACERDRVRQDSNLQHSVPKTDALSN